MTPDLVFRDPYLLDFLGLEDTYSERDLEAAILRELERFLLELGTDFSFIARQKRMTIGVRDFYLDLLFYHRSLRLTGRGAAHWADPVRREESGADRAIAAGPGRDQGGGVPGGAASKGDAGGKAARGHTDGERADSRLIWPRL